MVYEFQSKAMKHKALLCKTIYYRGNYLLKKRQMHTTSRSQKLLTRFMFLHKNDSRYTTAVKQEWKFQNIPIKGKNHMELVQSGTVDRISTSGQIEEEDLVEEALVATKALMTKDGPTVFVYPELLNGDTTCDQRVNPVGKTPSPIGTQVPPKYLRNLDAKKAFESYGMSYAITTQKIKP